jgi:hypothetical protein
MRHILRAALAVLTVAMPARAQSDASGIWDLNFNTPNGPISAAMTLKKEGEKLAGTLAGPQGEVAVQGSQKDKAIALSMSVQTQNGPLAIAMSGTQDGDAIDGTMDFGAGQAQWAGRRRAGASTPTASAQAEKPVDVSGVWAFQIETGQGTGTPTVTFKQDGEKLTGTYSSQVLGEQQLTGSVKGTAITFSFTATMEGNSFTVTYSGTVEKDTMKGKVNFGDIGEGTFTGKKKQAAPAL